MNSCKLQQVTYFPFGNQKKSPLGTEVSCNKDKLIYWAFHMYRFIMIHILEEEISVGNSASLCSVKLYSASANFQSF